MELHTPSRDARRLPVGSSSPITVMCVDDHNLVLEGLRLIIQRDQDLQVVATATNGQEAVRLFRRYKPDVTLMDLQLPVMGGLEAVKLIRREDSHARIVILTTYHGDEDIYRAVEAGAAAYIMKDALATHLTDIIRRVHAGENVMTRELQDVLDQRAKRPSLSQREIQVLQLISKGMRNKEIATILGISIETVQGYIKSMFVKLAVNDRTAAVNVGLKRSIIHLED
jgi:two-component system, NarL family, response regulator